MHRRFIGWDKMGNRQAGCAWGRGRGQPKFQSLWGHLHHRYPACFLKLIRPSLHGTPIRRHQPSNLIPVTGTFAPISHQPDQQDEFNANVTVCLRPAQQVGQLVRSLGLALLKITDVAEQEKAVIAMAEQSEGCHLTADELEAKVTVHLASIDKAIKPKPAEPKAENRDATDPVYGALFESTRTAYESVEQIIKVEAMRQVAKVIKAANRLGFAYCALLERLALESGEDASESAHKMINSLNAIIERGPQRANQDSLGSEEIKKQSGSTCRVKRTGKLRMISDEPSTILGAEAAKLLDWPQESGMKVVLSAQALSGLSRVLVLQVYGC